MTARTFLKKQGWLSDNKLQKRISQQDTSNRNELRYPLTPLIYGNDLQRTKNVLLITVDALRADMLNKTNMPFLYQLSLQGLNYQRHYSGANNRHQGLFSLFYGLPNRYWSEITLNYIPPVLMTRFKEKNYQFGLFSSIGFLHPEFLQSSFSQLNTKQLKHYSAENNNNNSTKEWQKWFASQDRSVPLFSFLHYEQHDKLVAQSSVLSLTEQASQLSVYQHQVLSTDEQIKKLITTLQSSSQLHNTIVIITGTHAKTFDKASTIEASINNAHVPLVILWPQQKAQQISRLTSHVDIVPTLMERLFNISSEANQYSSGQSLFDNTARQYLLSGDLKKYIIYEQDKITQFSNDGEINSINWQGEKIEEENSDITLLMDVLSKLRSFND